MKLTRTPLIYSVSRFNLGGYGTGCGTQRSFPGTPLGNHRAAEWESEMH